MARTADNIEVPVIAPDSIPEGHLKLKVRKKAHGKIATGQRVNHKDVNYSEGDVFTMPRDIAQVLLDKDYVDLAD